MDLFESLQAIERSIHVYKKDNHEIVKEINIDCIGLTSILTIVSPKDGDPLLYDFYELGITQVKWFQKYIAIEVNFDLYYYVLVCLGSYK